MDMRFLHHLPSEAIEELADDYEKQARELRRRARNMRQKEQDRRERERVHNARDEALKMVVDMIEHERKSLDAAFHAVAQFSGIPALTLEFDFNALMKKRDRRGKLARDAAVMGLMRAGLNNMEIAGRLPMHPNTVSNIKKKVMNP